MAFERITAEGRETFIPGDIGVALQDWQNLTPAEYVEACLNLAIIFERLSIFGNLDSSSSQRALTHAGVYLDLACQLEG